MALSDPGGGARFTGVSATSALTGRVAANRVNAARRAFLGYEYADFGSPYKLYRVPPYSHPEFPELLAVEVGAVRLDPCGKPTPGAFAAAPGAQGGTGAQPANPGKVAGAGPLGYTGRYEAAQFTATFGEFPYAVHADSEVTSESERWIDYYDSFAGETSVLSAQTGGALKWAEGYPKTVTAAGESSAGTIPGEVLQYITKSAAGVKWHRVPEEFVMNSATGIPDKILKCLGTVNSTTFLGWPPGVLLLLSASFERYLRPWKWPNGQPAQGFGVTFTFSHFDPVPAVTLESPASTPLFRGHNLHPFFPSKVGSVWYACLKGDAGDTPPPPRLIPQTDYNTMFDHVLKP